MKGLFFKLGLTALIAVVFLSINGCLGTSQGIPYYTISDEFAEYCWFGENSKWTYEFIDTASNVITDDVAIGEVIESQRFNPENEDYNYQAVEMIITDNEFGISKIELTAGDYKAGEGEMNSLMRFYYTDSTYQLIFMPQHPIGEEVILGAELGIYTNVAVLDTYSTFLGTEYTEVWHTRINVSSPSTKNMNFFIAKGYGLVEFKSSLGSKETVFTLKSSNLVPKILGK